MVSGRWLGSWLLAASSCAPATAARVAPAREDAAVVDVHVVLPAAGAAPEAAPAPQESPIDAGAANRDAAPHEAKVECSPPTAPAPHPLLYCELVELTGAPPCEWSCRVNEAPRKGATTRKSHQMIYAADGKRARELLRIEVFSGPAAPSPEDVLMKGTHLFIDESTTPPTVEARKGSCFFPAARAAQKRAPDSSSDEQDMEARAACPPFARYRFEGEAFKKLP